ncbi:23S rRNA (adenine(2030)-N(6))-methyltransferase RlmJ [Pseudorhodoferax sp.]|uniref:23S rRNA (adenine(2030)-N(6))-methyltransferase RlmJ n=1 Tax=Pseudorhodoferax sp. TaxID=1993553 RepID=UPI002DD6B54C|nr:23S rRNA (adenine(2030)-N(6))-methyltransferase RlmJ [Pseudorhodoferax sp.]
MLAYRHAFHAGNHADVLKHATLVAVLQHMNLKDKGYRVIDTHAGAGAYALGGRAAQTRREFDTGINRLWEAAGLPPLVQAYVEQVRLFNGEGLLRQYPGSPLLARQLMRPQDQLRLFELHATDHGLLAGKLRGDAQVEVKPADGFTVLKAQLPPPTRRGLLLMDPSYEIKSDYPRVLAALREALARFAECTVMIWLPQLQLLDAAKLPQRLKAAATGVAPKGWLLARLSVARPRERGFGMLGSWVFVANPPHTLAPALREALPWLAATLAEDEGAAGWACEAG